MRSTPLITTLMIAILTTLVSCNCTPRDRPDAGEGGRDERALSKGIVPPDGVAAASRCDGILVTWKAVENAATYRLYRSTATTFPSGEPPHASDLTGLNRLDQSAASSKGTTFNYWVTAVADCGESTPSDRVSGAVPPVPAIPTLSSESVGLGEGFIVRWERVTWADRYEVHWNSAASSNGRSLITGSGCQRLDAFGNCQYVDRRNLRPQAETRYYWVRAIGKCGESGLQATPIAITRPAQ